MRSAVDEDTVPIVLANDAEVVPIVLTNDAEASSKAPETFDSTVSILVCNEPVADCNEAVAVPKASKTVLVVPEDISSYTRLYWSCGFSKRSHVRLYRGSLCI